MKNIINISILLFLILISCSSLKKNKLNNTKIVRGVICEHDLPIAGIWVTSKRFKKSVYTNWDGEFEIETKEGDFLIISEHDRFQPQKIIVTKENHYKIFLKSIEYVNRKWERKRSREIRRYIKNGGRNIPPIDD